MEVEKGRTEEQTGKIMTFPEIKTRFYLRSILYVAFLAVWQFMMFLANIYKTPGIYYVALVLMIASLFWAVVMMLFEVRLVTPDGGRFLGYRAYILYAFHLFCFVLTLVATLLAYLFFPHVWYLCISFLAVLVVNIIIISIFLSPYRHLTLSTKKLIRISYLKKVKDWKIEGKLE